MRPAASCGCGRNASLRLEAQNGGLTFGDTVTLLLWSVPGMKPKPEFMRWKAMPLKGIALPPEGGTTLPVNFPVAAEKLIVMRLLL
jgi:hypothetical protein